MSSKYVLIILSIVVFVIIVAVLTYVFILRKRKSPPGSSPQPYSPSGGTVITPIIPPSYPPSPSAPPSTTLNITNLSTKATTTQNYFNYVDWNKSSKYFMVYGVGLYSKANLSDQWNYETQINYITLDGTQWYMQMNSPTTFHHYSQDGKHNQVSNYANMTSPDGTHYKISLV